MKNISLYFLILIFFGCGFIAKKKQEQFLVAQELAKHNLVGVWHNGHNLIQKSLSISPNGDFEINTLNCSDSSQPYLHCLIEAQEIKGDVVLVSDRMLKVFALTSIEFQWEPVQWNKEKELWYFNLNGEIFYRDDRN